MSRAFFSKPRPFFAVSTIRGGKTHGGLPKTRKTLSDSRVFWLIFFEFGDMFSLKFGTTSKPNPKSFEMVKLGGRRDSKSQCGNFELTNCLACFFQNSYKNVELSFTPPQNPRHVNKSPYSILCFRCFCMFYRKCKNLGKWKVRQTTNHRQCWWVLVVGGLSHF